MTMTPILGSFKHDSCRIDEAEVRAISVETTLCM